MKKFAIFFCIYVAVSNTVGNVFVSAADLNTDIICSYASASWNSTSMTHASVNISCPIKDQHFLASSSTCKNGRCSVKVKLTKSASNTPANSTKVTCSYLPLSSKTSSKIKVTVTVNMSCPISDQNFLKSLSLCGGNPKNSCSVKVKLEENSTNSSMNRNRGKKTSNTSNSSVNRNRGKNTSNASNSSVNGYRGENTSNSYNSSMNPYKGENASNASNSSVNRYRGKNTSNSTNSSVNGFTGKNASNSYNSSVNRYRGEYTSSSSKAHVESYTSERRNASNSSSSSSFNFSTHPGILIIILVMSLIIF